MTTPEKLKRRQLREGIVLIVLGIMMTASTLYFEQQRRDQREVDAAQERCFQENFVELSRVLELRADLSEMESTIRQREADARLKVDGAEQEIWSVYAEAAGLIKDDPTQELKPADQARLQTALVKALLTYQDTADEARTEVRQVKHEIRKIQRERERNPVPPYPLGACSKG